MTVNGVEYGILKLLGHGKGGYSYVIKQIHHEPCDYYSFGNKLEAERGDYGRLRQTGIRMPRMLDVDAQKERILKEYIEGPTVCQLVEADAMEESYFAQVRQMAAAAYAAGLNIDYFPTNFVVQNGLLYYIDYECNPYSEQWNFENWGVNYWSKTPEFIEYWNNHGK